jgi:phosphoglycolate phosphatase
MERFGLTDAVYIGDTQGDLVASRKAGIPFVYCAYGFGQPTEWDAKIEEFSQLPEVLKTL